jgi:hypothetical protein
MTCADDIIGRHTVGMTPPRPAIKLPAEHLVLVTEHQQLNILRQIRADQHG